MNPTALMDAIRSGRGKAAFLRDVVQELEGHEVGLLGLSQTGCPDQIFESLERRIHALGLKHFGQAPQAPNPQDSARRRELLAERSRLKGKRQEVDTGEELEEVERELRRLSARLKDERRRAARAEKAVHVALIEEAWRSRRLADAMHLSRRAARCRFGAKQRDGRRLGPVPLDKSVWESFLSLPGGEGGMKAKAISWEEWRAEHDDLPAPPTTAGDE
eukprot:8293821-Pyramimonas_sp.AAC.1